MIFSEDKLLSVWEWVESIGFVAVIIGCALEGVRHFPQILAKALGERFMHRAERIERIGWYILIIGLALEFLGGLKANSLKDSKIAQISAEASQLSLDAKRLEGSNLTLRSNALQLELAVHQLAHLYDQSTNALAEANKRLKNVRSLKERLFALIDRMDPGALAEVKKGTRMFKLTIPITMLHELQSLKAEEGGRGLILSVVHSGEVAVVTDGPNPGEHTEVIFLLSEKVFP